MIKPIAVGAFAAATLSSLLLSVSFPLALLILCVAVARFGTGAQILVNGYVALHYPASSSATGQDSRLRPEIEIGSGMAKLVPDDFDVPRELVTERFRLEPLGPQHNESDHAAWTSSIEHIRATPGFDGRSWPPPQGMTLEDNLVELKWHVAARLAGLGT